MPLTADDLDSEYEPVRFDPKAHLDSNGDPFLANVIVLFDQEKKRQVKRFSLGEDDLLQGEGFTSAYKGRPRQYLVQDLKELHSFLLRAEEKPKAVVLRGHPLVTKRKVRRLCKDRPDAEKTFVDAPRNWLCVDIDSLSVPPGLSYDCPDELAEYAVSKLPAKHFQGVSYIWQLSSSAALKAPDLIKLHIWFMLDTPRDCGQLKPWAKSLGGLIDPALYNPVQPHITARPIFIGFEDPFPQRTGLILKGGLSVPNAGQLRPPEVPERRASGRVKRKKRPHRAACAAPSPEAARGGGNPTRNWAKYLHQIEAEQKFHEPIYGMILSFFACGGLNQQELKEAIRREVIPRNTSERTEVESRYMTESYLDEQIQSALDYLHANQRSDA